MPDVTPRSHARPAARHRAARPESPHGQDGSLGYRIVADPSTPLLAAYATWKKVYDDLADGFGARSKTKPDWGPVEKGMVAVIGLEKLLAVERATVEKGKS